MTPALKFSEIFGPLNEAEKKFAPESVFALGDTKLLRMGARVSIIGAREASPAGMARARKLTRKLVELGITIVSGLAKGIDTAAHTAAIEAEGRTIAILGTPLSQVTPAENRELQENIAREHLLISQFPEGKPVGKGNFPIRNRLMALISNATVISEAGDGSGTAHQGWEAIRLARPLWILKSVVENKSLRWPKEFLEAGARILTEESLGEFENLRETQAVDLANFF